MASSVLVGRIPASPATVVLPSRLIHWSAAGLREALVSLIAEIGAPDEITLKVA